MSKEKTKAKSMPKPKQLTMNKIKNEAKKTYKLEEYIINDKNEAIKFYPIFPKGRIDDLLKELREDLIYAKENDIDLLIKDDFLIGYVYFLCIKYFTSLEKGFSNKLEDKILQFKYMKDSGYYDQIIKEVFVATELAKVTEALAEIFAMDQILMDLEQKVQNHLGSLQFRNKELIEKFDKQIEDAKKSKVEQ